MATLGLDTSEYEQGIEQARKETQSAANSLNRSANTAGNGVSGMASQFAAASAKATVLANMLTSLGTKAVGLAKNFVEMGISYNAQIEKYTTGFTNMLGSAQAAQEAMQAIQEDAARTPFDVASLTQANQLLISAGENAEYSRKVINALGDAVSATGGSSAELSRMAANLQQIANVGKAATIDIKQFAYAGINIYQILADYTGKSVQEVQSMTISYDLLSQALIAASEEGGRYYNAMDTQSQTMNGRISTLKDNVSQLAGALSENLSATFGTAVEKANELVVAMKEGWDDNGIDGLLQSVRETTPELSGLANIVQFCSDNANILVGLLGTAAGAMITYKTATGVAAAAQAGLNAVMNANPIGVVITLLGALAGALTTAYATNDKFREKWNSAWSSVKQYFSSVADFILDKLNRIMGVANGVANAIAAIGRGENPIDAYNEAYNSTRQSYADSKTDSSTGKKSTVTAADRKSRKEKHDARVRQAQEEALASSLTGGGSGNGGSSGKSSGSKSTTETVIASVTHTATTTAQNALGAVTTSVETLQEKVKDAAGNIKDRVTETTTETGKEMVNGVATTYTLVTKKVTDANGKISTTTKKVYADMSKTLLGTLTTIAEKTFNGITTTTQQAVETYADGSQHIKTTATETGERIVDGVRQTYTKVISYIDGVQDKVTETAQNIDKSIKATQKRIEENLSKAQQQFNSGIFKLGKNLYTDLKNQDWAALGLDIVNVMWGEVSQEQREVLSDWANKALEAINEAYSGGGLSEAFNAFKQIMSNGIKAEANGVTTDVKGLSKVFQELGINVSDVGSKIMGVLGTIGTSMGNFAVNAGTDIAGLAGNMGSLGTIAESAGGLIAKVGSLIISNPEVAAIIAIVAGVVALGVALWAKFGKGKSSGTTSTQHVHSYKDIQDAYWYGNERAFAGYDYRTDPYVMNPDNNAMLAYRAKMQALMERLYGVVEKYLPEAGNSVIALDGEQVGRIITPSVNRSLGDLTVLSERGN
nr:MAG TPA: tail tape measure protein [Bacteriophage sp.]